MRINTILVILISIAHLGYAFNGQYPIKNFTTLDYKAGIQNIDFAQNRDMNLFVANNLGILSFNGNEWETHALNTGKKQRSLAFDDEMDRLYVGSQGEFGFYDKGWVYTSLSDLIPTESRDFDEVWDVFIVDQKVYFFTFQRIYIYDNAKVSTIDLEGGLQKSFYAGNRLFTQSSSGQLYEVSESGLQPNWHQQWQNDIVAGVIRKDQGFLLFYNSGNIEFSTRQNATLIFQSLAKVLKGKYVNHVIQLSDNRLVISTQRSGLYLFNTQTQGIDHISIKDGLQTNECLRTFQDFSGNLWVGMQNGIALIDINSPMRLIGKEMGIQGSGYEVYEFEKGTYYTTSNGIYFLDKITEECTFMIGTEGPAYSIQQIGNHIYAGHHTGLFLLEGSKAQKRASTDGLWKIIPLQSNSEYAIGGTYSGLRLFKLNATRELEDIGQIKGFNESSRFFEEDRNGNIWVGQFYKGLYKIVPNATFTDFEVSRVSNPSDLPIDQHVILDKIGEEIYLGTEKGLYRIDQVNGTIIKDDIFNETVGDQWVYSFVEDTQKNVHIFTEKLVGFFKPVSSSNYVYVPSSLFQLKQAFNNDLLSISKNVANGVLFNANEGFIHYAPNLEDQLSIKQQPQIKSIANVGDSTLYQRMPFKNRQQIQPIWLTEGTRVLQFNIESFNFRNVENSQFRYILEGFDTDYSEWTSSTIKEYTNLKEGDYRFFVQSLNYLGEIVTSEPVILKIHPPFFRSTIAKVIYGLAGVFLLFLSYRFQRKHYKKKEAKLKDSKQQELAQKQSELHDLREEKIKSELRHVNNLLAASTMNLVVKNEFMENIKEEIKQVRTKGEADEETQKALRRIVKEIDTTLRLQEDWKQFEHHFDKVHGDFLTRLTHEFRDLTPGEQKLCAFLRLKMDTKEIANLMSISLRGVEVARYRLRKKLSLTTEQNLSKFILEY